MSVFERRPTVPSEVIAAANTSAVRLASVLFVQAMVVCVAMYFFLADRGGLNIEWISRLLLVHFVWVLWSWRKLTGSLLNPYVLFMLSATLFNAGLGLVVALHFNRQPVLDEFPMQTQTGALLLVLAALAALHFGAVLALRHRPAWLGVKVEMTPTRERALRLVGLGLLAISIVPMCLQVIEAVSIAISVGYMGMYRQDVGAAGVRSALVIATDLVVLATFFICVGTKRGQLERRVVLAIFLIYCASLLFVGLRGSALTPVVALAWLWDRSVSRLSRPLLGVIGAILLVLIFPFVRSIRTLSGAERKTVSVGQTYKELEEHPAVDAIAEMGGSILPVAHTLELVPQFRPYDMGLGYWYAILTLVPSLFWERHPAAVADPAAWLMETVDPIGAKLGYGLGFSFIAEAFLSFGALGVPLVALLLGYAVVRLWLWAERGLDPGRFVVVAVLLWPLLFYPRGSFFFLPRSLVWYGLVPYWVYLFVSQRLKRGTAPPLNRFA